jgi:hypothetical protein
MIPLVRAASCREVHDTCPRPCRGDDDGNEKEEGSAQGSETSRKETTGKTSEEKDCLADDGFG